MPKEQPGEWDTKIKYIVAAPYLNDVYKDIDAEHTKPVMDWQFKEISLLLLSVKETKDK